MRSACKYRPALLALMLVLTQVALASHMTAHFFPHLDECELCVSQAHPVAAIPPTQPLIPGHTLAQRAVFEVPRAPDGVPAVPNYRQRAPPTSST